MDGIKDILGQGINPAKQDLIHWIPLQGGGRNFGQVEYYNQDMFGDALKRLKQPIFITGHTGFKGSWLGLLLDHLGIEHFGYSLEAEASSLFSRAKLGSSSKGAIGDIRDLNNLSRFLGQVNPSVVVHLAAQPLVLKSYEEPLETFQTNCIGTANLLEAAFQTPSVKVILVITTDKVYRNENKGSRFSENDPLEGKDPYSASKVAAESVCAAWQQKAKVSGGPKVIVARAGNVIGGGDFADDRLIPDLIRSFLSGDKVKIRNPKATRPWQHVLDPLIGYLKFIEYSLSENHQVPALNFGPLEPSLEVCRVLEIFESTFQGKILSELELRNDSFESQRLDLDSTRAINLLGWEPRWNQEEAIAKTIEWWNKVIFEKSGALEMCQNDVQIALNID